MSEMGLGRVKTKSDLVVMPSGVGLINGKPNVNIQVTRRAELGTAIQ